MMKYILKFLKITFLLLGVLVLGIAIFFGHRDLPLDELKAKYANPPSAFIQIDGLNVHYRDEGNSLDSLPIVLIHGTGASLHTFDDWVITLKKERRVLRMDIPAFGLTGPFPDRDYSIANYVYFIKKFLDKIGIHQCVLGGNSLGGEIAWRFTLEYPNYVKKLILIDAAGYPLNSKSVPIAFKFARLPVLNKLFTYITSRSLVQKSLENVYANPSKISESLVDRYVELSLRKGNRQAFVDGLNQVDKINPIDQIKNIEQPILILWGQEDYLIPISVAHQFHEDLPNDTLVILKNIGHVPMEESPEESLIPLLEFLNK